VEATPLQRGRTQQLWQVFITDEQQRLVAKGEVRLANITDPGKLG
jgi:acyl-coenzyme A thioesterase PaaI-like protein